MSFRGSILCLAEDGPRASHEKLRKANSSFINNHQAIVLYVVKPFLRHQKPSPSGLLPVPVIPGAASHSFLTSGHPSW